jgi:hypothetical protein
MVGEYKQKIMELIQSISEEMDLSDKQICAILNYIEEYKATLKNEYDTLKEQKVKKYKKIYEILTSGDAT